MFFASQTVFSPSRRRGDRPVELDAFRRIVRPTSLRLRRRRLTCARPPSGRASSASACRRRGCSPDFYRNAHTCLRRARGATRVGRPVVLVRRRSGLEKLRWCTSLLNDIPARGRLAALARLHEAGWLGVSVSRVGPPDQQFRRSNDLKYLKYDNSIATFRSRPSSVVG